VSGSFFAGALVSLAGALVGATFFSAGGAALVGLGGSFFLSSLEESLEESVFFSGAFLSSTVFDSALGSGFFLWLFLWRLVRLRGRQ